MMPGLACLSQANSPAPGGLSADGGWFTLAFDISGGSHEKRQRFWFLIKEIVMKDNDTQGS
jgi:hypothetical protein